MATASSEAAEALYGLSEIVTAEVRTVVSELRRQGLTAEQARDALMDLLPDLGTEYRLAAASLAADWYDDLRIEQAAAGRFIAEPVLPPTRARWQALTRWGVDPLFAATPDWAAAASLIGGGLQRTVVDGHRLTVVENAQRDPQAAGWSRVARPGACGFCRMLADRPDAVYTEASVTFRSHDHCHCAASPSWASNVVKVSREPYRQSQRRRSDDTKKADNARAREYIAANYGDN